MSNIKNFIYSNPLLSAMIAGGTTALLCVAIIIGAFITTAIKANNCKFHEKDVRVIKTGVEGRVRWSGTYLGFKHQHSIMYENDIGEIKYDVFFDEELQLIEN